MVSNKKARVTVLATLIRVRLHQLMLQNNVVPYSDAPFLPTGTGRLPVEWRPSIHNLPREKHIGISKKQGGKIW